MSDILSTLFQQADKSLLQLIKERMQVKMKYAKGLPTCEEFTKELAKGFIEIYRSLGL